VPTACGARSVPIAAQEMAVPVAEVAQASAMLLRLQEQGGQVQAASGKDYTANGSTMKWLAPGSFTMGCTAGQGSACESDEKPSHQVSLSGFWMASVETTQRQWTAVTGSRHSSYSSSCGEDCPVVNINWCEALSFANARSKKEGLKPAYTLPWSGAAPTGEACDTASPTVQWDRSADGYRLPTEAEWEYAARAGKDTLYAGGAELNALGWYDKNSGGGVHPVGQKAANAWGLYDMSGNVWEWAWDWVGPYTASNAANPSGPTSGVGRVNRGGSFRNEATRMRVANRNRNNPQRANDNQGFRLCLGLTDRGLPGAPAPQPAVARAYPEQAPLRVALPAPSPTCSRRPGRASGWAPFSCCAPDARIVRRGAACGGREAATVAPGQRPHPKLSPSTEGGGPSGAPQATAAP
jgi:formylglycine-generating enzyme required for sulfatase activity